MSKWLESRIMWGSLLILGGVMFLLQNLGVFQFGSLFWALLFLLAGLFFISIFIQNQANWWALIPGGTLLSISALITLEQIAPRLGNLLGGAVVLGGIGLSFLVVYLVNRRNWWAIIPAGVMLTLMVISSLDAITSGIETGGLLFLGLGATFALVALAPTGAAQMRWAWIPAGILAAMGLLIMAAAGDMLGYLWPLALILVGGFLILRNYLSRAN